MSKKELEYLKIKNITENSADIYFYGEIVGDEWDKWCDTDTCPIDVLNALKETEGKALNIYINSPGGSVFAGLAIANMLSRKKEKKVCYIDGLAASVASILPMVCDEIVMPSNSFMMVHKPWNCVCGNANDMRKAADELDIIQSGIEQMYKSRLKKDADENKFIELINNETWLTAQETSQYFDIKIIESNNATMKLVDTNALRNYKNVPQCIFDIQNNLNDKLLSEMESELLNMELSVLSI